MPSDFQVREEFTLRGPMTSTERNQKLEQLNSLTKELLDDINKHVTSTTRLGEMTATLIINFHQDTGKTIKIAGCTSDQTPIKMLITCLTHLVDENKRLSGLLESYKQSQNETVK